MQPQSKPGIQVVSVMKFGDRRYLTALRDEGLLYCNPLSFFRDSLTDRVRRDKRDGISMSLLPRDVTSITISNPEGTTVLTPENGLIGRVDIHDGGPEPNLYCMCAVRANALPWKPDPRLFEFGACLLVITDLDKFHERLHAAVKAKGIGLRVGLVEYVDSTTFSGELGLFRKFSEFAFQSEVRFAFDPGSIKPIELRLGSLSDISVLFDIDGSSDVEVRGDAIAAA